MPKTVLFICTGNYYRSRFAEYWFNHLAPMRAPDWIAGSAGLRPDFAQRYNVGPLSPDARRALDARRVELPDPPPMPRPLTAADLAAADLAIALDDPEHRPMMHALFPDWAQRIGYWQVRDVSPSEAYDPMAAIDERVVELLDRLTREPT